MAADSIWFLHCTTTKENFENLSLHAAKQLLLNKVSNSNEYKRWLAWADPMPEWKSVQELPELHASAQQDNGQESAPPPIPFRNEKSEEKRKHIRHTMRLRVILSLDSKTFRTFTRDISEGGMLLEDKVPDIFLSSACDIFIGSPNKKENIQFIGNVVGDTQNAYRFAFLEQGVTSPQRLAEWLELFNSGLKAA